MTTAMPEGRVWFFRDVTDARRAKAASDVLALSGELFTAPLDAERTLGELAELVVPQMADWAAVDIVDEHFDLPHDSASRTSDPAATSCCASCTSRYPLRPNEGHLRGRVLATLEPIALYDVDEHELRGLARDERAFRDAHARSGCARRCGCR